MTLLRHIFLHVGLPKTGTSAIQRSFARNPGLTAARDLLYPAAGRSTDREGNPGHHNLAYELYSPAQFDENAGGWAAVQREVESSDVSRVLISTEAFREFLAPVVAAKSRKLFPGAAVTVVLYLRPEWEYIESAYNQLARFGQVDQPIGAFWNAVGRDRAKYRRVVEVWQRHFGESNVSCLPFDTPAKRLGPVEHFARNALGFEPGAATACEEARIAALDAGREPGPRIANPKVGMRAIGAVRYARDHYREKTGNPAAALPSRAVARILRNFREAGDDTSQSFMDAALGSLIFAESVETNRWLVERFPAFGSADFMEEPDWTRLRTARTLPEMDRAEKEFCRRVVRLTIKGTSAGRSHRSWNVGHETSAAENTR